MNSLILLPKELLGLGRLVQAGIVQRWHPFIRIVPVDAAWPDKTLRFGDYVARKSVEGWLLMDISDG